MQHFTQSILADDPSGERGNCFSTCIACILGVLPEKIPNFCNADNWREEVNRWLANRGLAYMDVILPGDARDELVAFWGYHVISGKGPRGHRHSVVGLKGQIAWDPHPSRAGLLGTPEDWEYGFLVKTFL